MRMGKWDYASEKDYKLEIVGVNTISLLSFGILVHFCYTLSMIPLEKNEYPTDFHYHRTSSPTYRAYLENSGLATLDTISPYFFWKKKIFGNFFGIIKVERVPTLPDIEDLKIKTWLKHAFIVYIPYGDVKIPSPWRRLWFSDHFEETGYAKLAKKVDTDNTSKNKTSPAYLASWNERSRRAYKKYEKSGATLRAVTPDLFVSAFRAAKLRTPHKWAYISYYKKMVAMDSEKIHQWIVYDTKGEVIAGLATHDYLATHSVHLVAFTDPRYYDYQWGTALMHEWFRTSYEHGITYLSLDHLRNQNGPKDQKWYTAFKENFLSARLSFREAYFRFF